MSTDTNALVPVAWQFGASFWGVEEAIPMAFRHLAIPLYGPDTIERLTRERDALQARVDALMLEYCPDEMTPEQIEEWGRHQRPGKTDPTKATK